MYKGDGAVLDGTECLLEETSDEAERPLTLTRKTPSQMLMHMLKRKQIDFWDRDRLPAPGRDVINNLII